MFIALPANASTLYSHVITSSGVNNPSHGVGAPDGSTLSFQSDSAWVEFGFPQETTGKVNFKVFVGSTNSHSLDYWIMNGATILRSSTLNFVTNNGSMEIDTASVDAPFDRVRVFPNTPLFEIDAAWVTVGEAVLDVPDDSALIDTTTPDAQETSETPDESSSAEEIASTFPRLVKLPSDGDANTQYDTAVYAIDPLTGKRRPFFNETIYRSWFGSSFDRVEIITAEEMAAYPMGSSMFMHPGTYLVKVQSANAVYAVETDGVLRYIPSEAMASQLYGPNWNQVVRDLSPTEWPRYTVGHDLEAIFPDGTIVMDGHLITWRIQNGMRRQVPFSDLAYHGVQVIFAIPYGAWFGMEDADTRLSIYPIGMIYTRSDNVGWFDF